MQTVIVHEMATETTWHVGADGHLYVGLRAFPTGCSHVEYVGWQPVPVTSTPLRPVEVPR